MRSGHLANIPSQSFAAASLTAKGAPAVQGDAVRDIALGDAVFRSGEARHVYRVESGAVSHFQRWPDGHVDVIEFAFPGDVIGVGYLPDHTSSAIAMVDTVVSVMSTETLEVRLNVDDRLALSFAAAGEREFEFLRAKTVRRTLLPPLQKLATYLLAISSIAGGEGRTPAFATHEIASDHVADQLRISLETLSMALLSLRSSGIVDVCGDDLNIVDLDKLEAVAAA